MIAKNALYKEIDMLPVKERVKIIDHIYNSFDKIDREIESAWVKESKSRIKAVKQGKMRLIPGALVLGK